MLMSEMHMWLPSVTCTVSISNVVISNVSVPLSSHCGYMHEKFDLILYRIIDNIGNISIYMLK